MIRSVLAYLIALVTLAAAVVAAARPVLCVGPDNHCHVEAIVAVTCQSRSAGPHRSVPEDGCPQGSKDLRLTVDTHRTNYLSSNAVAPSVFMISSSMAAPATQYESQLRLRPVLLPPRPKLSAAVLLL